jgi:hypothetical protein
MKDPHNLEDEYGVGVDWASRSHLMTIWLFASYPSIAVGNVTLTRFTLKYQWSRPSNASQFTDALASEHY